MRARYYASGTGRFTSHDLWSGDSLVPMSFNAWLYTYSNPIRYIDVNGHFPSPAKCGGLEGSKFIECIKTYERNSKIEDALLARYTDNGKVMIPPPGITWSPVVSSPSSLNQVGKTQNWVDTNGNRIIADEDEATWGYNLCGQISEAFVLEAILGKDYRLTSVVRAMNRLKNGNWNNMYTGTTTAVDLAKALLIRNYHSELHGFFTSVHHRYYEYGQAYHLELVENTVDFKSNNFEFRFHNETIQHHYNRENFDYPNQIRGQLALGHYHIALVDIDTSKNGRLKNYNTGTGHWIAITGFSAQWSSSSLDSKWNWVRIYNPYENRIEYYSWKEFRNSVRLGTALEIWEDSSVRNNYVEGN
jgi:hypothetical protein